MDLYSKITNEDVIAELQAGAVLLKKERYGLLEENAKLKEYATHKEGCPVLRKFYIPECPHCGSLKNHRRHGVHYEHQRMCEEPECKGPAYIPKTRFGECTCGLEDILK